MITCSNHSCISVYPVLDWLVGGSSFTALHKLVAVLLRQKKRKHHADTPTESKS